MNGKKWAIADVVLGVVGGLCGLFGILTGIKRAGYDEEQKYADFEERYGLSPIDEEEDE